jgi:NUMOD3 motif
MTAFYVYEHIRRDTGAVFYVGKGRGGRHCSKRDRNQYWHNVVNKAGGFDSRVVIEDQSEELILLAEIEKINQLRTLGVTLVNLTDGGEGITGLKHSEESKRLMSQKLKGKSHKHKPEAIEKIRQANTGVVFSDERKEKLRQKALGRKMPPHVRQMLHERMKSFKQSEETKEHLRQVNLGRKHTPEALAKMSAWQKDLPKIICPHCNKGASAGMAKRWHFDNCKMKDTNG